MKIILLLILLFLTSAYLTLDKHLYFYGKNDIDVYNFLPFKIKPDFKTQFIIDETLNFEKNFRLRDEHGFSIVAPKMVYIVDKKVEVSKIIKYCFNEKNIFVVIRDFQEKLKYIFFELKKDYFNVNIKDDISKDEWRGLQCILIENNSEQIKTIEELRNAIYLPFLIFMFLFLTEIKNKHLS
ncbi:hypothetical protein [Tenacibaculum xiamenense]|uniref:hypothetical protein n=1 Tax=Tenacibaculum xiamenense TaxID=1261553 RepID=UPI0038B4F1B6